MDKKEDSDNLKIISFSLHESNEMSNQHDPGVVNAKGLTYDKE